MDYSSIVSLVLAFVSKYPISASIFVMIGVFRTIFKPIMSVLAAYVMATPSIKDDSWLAAMQENKIYKGFAWFVDFATSIKLPGQK